MRWYVVGKSRLTLFLPVHLAPLPRRIDPDTSISSPMPQGASQQRRFLLIEPGAGKWGRSKIYKTITISDKQATRSHTYALLRALEAGEGLISRS